MAINKEELLQSIGRTPIDITLEPEEPEGYSHKLSDLIDRALNLQRNDEQGILNESNGAGAVVRKDGQVNISASKYAQYKMVPNGRAVEQTMESVAITNRRKILTDDLIINEHKLNPQLWEMADFRTTRLPTNDHAFVGGLCMMGSVLVKAWEPNLKRYMLIRRPWMGPVFGPTLNVAQINPALGIADPLDMSTDILAISDKGYQVSGAIKDGKSLIGKSGQDRSGIDRGSDAMSSNGSSTGGSSIPGASLPALGANAVDPGIIFKALKKLGYNDIAACGIMGNIQQESGFDTKAGGGVACGLFQWGNGCDGGRWQGLLSKYPDPQCWDAGNQLSYMYWECSNGYTNCLPSTMNNFSTPEQACQHFEEHYEKAGDANQPARDSYARQFYEKFKGQ